MDSKKVTVVLYGHNLGFIDGSNKYIIKIAETKSNPFYTILSAFIKFAEEYDKIIQSDEDCIIYTNLFEVISSASRGYSDKKVEEMIAFAYKAIKIGGFRRPNKFVFVNTGKELNTVLPYCKEQIFESQDGDNDLIDIKSLYNNTKIDNCTNDSCAI